MRPLSNVTDPAVVKALAHPLRVQILGILEHRTASPNELAQEIGAPLGNVSYHMRQLESFGLVKLVKETPRRGAVEHYYRLDMRPSISDEGWARAPSIVKEALSKAVISQIGSHVVDAAEQGAFERPDIHLSRLPLTLDEKGFKAAAQELERVVEKLRRIEESSAKRLARTRATEQVDALAVLMLFESSGKAPAAPAPRRRRKAGAASRSAAVRAGKPGSR